MDVVIENWQVTHSFYNTYTYSWTTIEHLKLPTDGKQINMNMLADPKKTNTDNSVHTTEIIKQSIINLTMSSFPAIVVKLIRNNIF